MVKSTGTERAKSGSEKKKGKTPARRLDKPKRKKFSTEEDTLLIDGLKRFGPKAKPLQSLLPHRSTQAIMSHIRFLRKNPPNQKAKEVLLGTKETHIYWKEEEIDRLIKLYNQGCNFQQLTKHFPGRSQRQIAKKIFGLRDKQRKEGKKVPAHMRVGYTHE